MIHSELCSACGSPLPLGLFINSYVTSLLFIQFKVVKYARSNCLVRSAQTVNANKTVKSYKATATRIVVLQYYENHYFRKD